MEREGTHTKTTRKGTNRDSWLCPAAIPDYPETLQPTGLSLVTVQKRQSLKKCEVKLGDLRENGENVKGKCKGKLWGEMGEVWGENGRNLKGNRRNLNGKGEGTFLDFLKPDMDKIMRNYSVGRAVFLEFASSIPLGFFLIPNKATF